jgi:predicted nucleic acid-binding protein
VTVFFDTSVLVAALVERHSRHSDAFSWLLRVRSGEVTGVVSTHTLAELYAVLTTLPLRPRVSASEAQRLVQATVRRLFRLVSLTGADYLAVVAKLADAGIIGGVVYDALAARAAKKGRADRLMTLNHHDFARLAPIFSIPVVGP